MERILSADDFSSDHLGTPVAVSDPTGQVVWTHRFSPFGKTIELNEDVDGDGEKVTLNLRFPGQYYDAESGLHYNWHRYYDPETGRYVTVDQVEVTDIYQYTNNNPIAGRDIMGNSSDGCVPTPSVSLQQALNKLQIYRNSMKNYSCIDEVCTTIDYKLCDEVGGVEGAVGRAVRQLMGQGPCEILIKKSAWYADSSAERRGCIIGHEMCHLRQNNWGSECEAYTSQATCYKFFHLQSDDVSQTAHDRCDDENNPCPFQNDNDDDGGFICK